MFGKCTQWSSLPTYPVFAVTEYMRLPTRQGGTCRRGTCLRRSSPTAAKGRCLLRLPARLPACKDICGRLSDKFTVHSFRLGGSLTQSLSGTAVDEGMKLGGWKTAHVASGTSGRPLAVQVGGSKRKQGGDYALANDLTRLLLSGFWRVPGGNFK
ncbi:unnamed protein product [Ectocarpus sp. 4 AP-2014]